MHLTHVLFMNPKSDMRMKKSALTPALSPGEREKGVSASWQKLALLVQGFNMRMLRGNLSPF
jgi:hypothetical protein